MGSFLDYLQPQIATFAASSFVSWRHGYAFFARLQRGFAAGHCRFLIVLFGCRSDLRNARLPLDSLRRDDVAVEQWHAFAAHEQYEDGARDDASHMRAPGDHPIEIKCE